MLQERMIWLTTARGSQLPITAMSGLRQRWWPAGRPITTVAGCGLRPGAGRGWMMRHGASLRFTTVAGLISAAGGAGCRGHDMCDLCMRRQWLPGLEVRVPMCPFRWAAAPGSAGFRWDLARWTYRAIARAAPT